MAEEPAEGLEGEASQLRRRMRDTRFRPRWEGGGPVATTAVVRQYAWLD